MTAPRVWPGDPYPLGATFDGMGTRFSVVSSVAEAVELCLFDEDGTSERGSSCPSDRATCGTASCPTCSPASATATGCTGPGTRPRACAATRPSSCSTPTPRPSRATSTGTRRCSATAGPIPTSATTTTPHPHVPRSVVINPYFDWAGDRRPRCPWADTVIYETHVRGATIRHPDVPEDLRGTYGGIAHPAFVGAPAGPRRHRRGAPARPPVRAGRPPRRARVWPTTGATTRSASWRPRAGTRRGARPASRCRRSARWCGTSTRRASR